jgi:hypothetical protein
MKLFKLISSQNLMGRKRDIPVTIFYSDSEYEKLRRKISKAKITPSTSRSSYIRDCSLGNEIKVIPGLRDFNNTLIKVVDELNLINRKINYGEVKETGSNLDIIKEAITNIYKELNKISKNI